MIIAMGVEDTISWHWEKSKSKVTSEGNREEKEAHRSAWS